MEVELAITLDGTRPLITHNARLANPLDPIVRELKRYTGKRKKTDEDLAAIMHLEMIGGVYETDEGLVGLPTENVWRSIYDAATAFKRGADIKRALIAPPNIEPVEIAGGKMTVDEFVAREDSAFFKSVVVSRSRTMRTRPIMHNWRTRHVMTLSTDIIDIDQLNPILERAGKYVGVGTWRPRYGTYEATVEVLS